MPRAGFGRSPAWITGLLALILLVVPGRPYELPEHYRVELEVPPVDAALWFVARYPQYFTSGETGLGSWLEQLDPRDREFVLAMAQTLTWAWVEHELARFDEHELDDLALQSIEVVRRETLNQLELNVDHHQEIAAIEFDAYVGDPHFASGVFARLLRGVSNCEGQNHLLAVLLDAALEPGPPWVPSVDAIMVGVPRHELVRLVNQPLEQPVFVDAWSNLPPFTLDPNRPRAAPTLAELGASPPPVVPGLAGVEPRPADEYAHSQGTAITLLPGRRAPTKRVDLKVRAPRIDPVSLAKYEDPWQVYLFARVLDVYDDPRAADLYRFLIEHYGCEQMRPLNFVCQASMALLARL
jgi:hypothetical protein